MSWQTQNSHSKNLGALARETPKIREIERKIKK
jgi:hypothetical protein